MRPMRTLLLARNACKSVLLPSLLGATLAVPRQTNAQWRHDTLTARIDSVFADVNTTASPGCALGIIRDGALIYARGYGMANLDEDIALSPTSAFYIASTSKQFAAASVLLLAQEGKLSLDEDVRKYIPELPDYGARVTIRHLLHHTSGIRDYLGLLMGLGAGRVENVMSDDDIIALIARQKALNFPPGSEYSYSNSGYFLLGQIVKRVSGTSLRAYADAHIFRPLGMLHTRFHDDRLQSIPHRVIGYDPGENGFVIDYYANFQGVGDGGLWSTIEDLARWDRNFYDPIVGGSAFLKEELAPGRLTSGDTITYASGLMLGRYRGLQTVSHGGSFMGYRSEFLRFPAQRFSVICLCNLSTSNPTARARKIADIFLAAEFPRAVATTDSARSEYRVELAATTLAAIAGTYRNPTTGMVWTLAVRDGHLTADAFGARIPLAALSATHFRSTRGTVPVDMVVQPSTGGSAPRLRVLVGEDGGPPEVFERVSPPSLTRTQLAEYAGAYDSDELRATYTVTVSGDSLYVAIPNRPKQAVVPTTGDAFVAPGLSFAFQRNGSGRITGLVVWAAQDRNIHLQRRTPAGRP
jgi:CubicO group peptidase (beta-lactamase class C family)